MQSGTTCSLKQQKRKAGSEDSIPIDRRIYQEEMTRLGNEEEPVFVVVLNVGLYRSLFRR